MPAQSTNPNSPTVYDYAALWRDARVSKSTGNILRPPGAQCMLAGHFNDRYPDPQGQDRIYTPYREAWQMRRSAGYIANIRYGETGLNIARPASCQVVIKLMWYDYSAGRNRHVFDRTTAHASAFAPRLISPCSFPHIALGDIVSGVLEAPRSKQCSTNLISWSCPELAMLVQIHGPQVPGCSDIVLEPGVVADLPQLGGLHFWPPPR